MRTGYWLSVLRLAALVALAASAALYHDYTTSDALFCGKGSGCAAVRSSDYGYVPLGETRIPVPVLGLVGFAVVLAASMLAGASLRRRVLTVTSYLGGAAAALLLYLQATKIGAFCTLCVVADSAAIVIAACAFAYRTSSKRQTSRSEQAPWELRNWAWAALGAVAIAAPLIWASVRPMPPVPAGVRSLYVAGKINVVEFADYQCPFCRELHFRLKKIIESYPGQVNFVRLNFPLASHEFALGAARAAVCADVQGKGAEMADSLFGAEDLTSSANRQAALRLGLDMTKFDVCVSHPSTDRRIDAEAKILRDFGLQGLPTTFVGGAQVIGAQADEKFRDAFDRAQRGEHESKIGGFAFVAMIGVVTLAIAALGRRRGREAC